jgi:archaellum biogenesis ATPase FlaH
MKENKTPKSTKTDHEAINSAFGYLFEEAAKTASITSVAKKTIKKSKSTFPIEKSCYSAFELYQFKVPTIPKLLDPFLQTVGLASLVGTSDSGKSTFLRQLSLSIVLGLDNFIGFPLQSKHQKVIYVSTEDDSISISFSLRKQINHLQKEFNVEQLDGLKNLDFIFDTTDLLENLTKRLKKDPVDLIIIDAFTDVFTKEINANTQVRTFLNKYDQLAKKHNCLILFLHHTGKRTSIIAPTKDSIIGSQGFEAKMRVVLEIRPNFKNDNQKDLWVLKSNFLEAKHKSHSYILDFSKDLIFSNTGFRASKQVKAKSNDTELIETVMKLHNQGLSTRKIEEELKHTEFKVSKSVIAEIIKKNIS